MNIGRSFTKFLGNKNTVTILGVLVGVVVLFFFYKYRVNRAITPMTVPCATQTINATDKITKEMITNCEVTEKFLRKVEIKQKSSEVIDKYVTTGTSIPQGGLFYVSQIVEKAQLPNTIFDDIPDGYTIYGLSVNNHTTYGNSIYPGDKIDLYLKATDDSGKIIFGKFIESITVLGVRDSSGKNVFDTTETRTPAELLFAVEDKMYELLKKSDYISGITVIPVPRNKAYTQEGGDVVTKEFFENFILSKTLNIAD